MSKLQKIENAIVEVPSFSSFTVLGDPGCDGLGAEILSLYARALAAARGDFTLVAGDLVPEGEDAFYRQTNALIERASQKPVYLLRGNHDTGAYGTYYGRGAYALHDERTLLVVLDNSLGRFTEESMELLRAATAAVPCRDLILAMHIPPANRVTDKAVSRAEWERVRAAVADSPCAGRLRYCIAGHVHSYFEDDLDGARLVVTGGSGARIAPMAGVETPYNHYVEFAVGADGAWGHEKVDLNFLPQPQPAQPLRDLVDHAFGEECRAFVRYLLQARDARARGYENLAQLFEAAGRAEFFHARNHAYTLGLVEDPAAAVRSALLRERQETQEMYPQALALAREAGEGLCAATLEDALFAEEKHAQLFARAEEALERGDIPAETYYTCTSCGATFAGGAPGRCPVCGAPADKIERETAPLAL